MSKVLCHRCNKTIRKDRVFMLLFYPFHKECAMIFGGMMIMATPDPIDRDILTRIVYGDKVADNIKNKEVQA